jgi:hypothetical protein
VAGDTELYVTVRVMQGNRSGIPNLDWQREPLANFLELLAVAGFGLLFQVPATGEVFFDHFRGFFHLGTNFRVCGVGEREEVTVVHFSAPEFGVSGDS